MIKKNCPRCSNEMVCQPDNIIHCACSTVSIGQSLRTFLAKTHYDCLCTTCLSALSALVEQAESDALKPETLQEGLHYYREGKFIVLTEYYHIAKGHCCQNGCRHCAYNYHPS